MVFIRDQRWSPTPGETPDQQAVRGLVDSVMPYRDNSLYFGAQMPSKNANLDSMAPLLLAAIAVGFLFWK